MLAVIALVAVASFATGTAAEQGYTTPAQIFAGAVSNACCYLSPSISCLSEAKLLFDNTEYMFFFTRMEDFVCAAFLTAYCPL